MLLFVCAFLLNFLLVDMWSLVIEIHCFIHHGHTCVTCSWFRQSVCHTSTLWTGSRLNRYVHLQVGRHVNHAWRKEFFRSEVKVTIDKYGNNLVNLIEIKTFKYILSNLAQLWQAWPSLEGSILKVKVTIDKYGNNPVNMIEIKFLYTYINYSTNVAYVGRINPKGQGHNRQIWK